MGINLLDCASENLDEVNEKIYRKITTLAKDLVSTGEEIAREFGVPIVNKRISITPISLVGAAACKTPEDYVTIARHLTAPLTRLALILSVVILQSCQRA